MVQGTPFRAVWRAALRKETVGSVGEFPLIERLAGILGGQIGGASTVAGIGDDAAVLDLGGPEYLLATVDMTVEDVHFRVTSISPYDLGRRALAVNLSDIAAMGGRPTSALLSLALRPDLPLEWLEEVYRGIGAMGKRFGTPVVGGNITRTPGPLTIDITLLGAVSPQALVLRSGARPGDVLAVTGPLGRRAAHRLLLDRAIDAAAYRFSPEDAVPEPRVAEGQMLAASGAVHAMLDLSDGLAGDLRHLANASGAGIALDLTALPIDDATRDAAAVLGIDPLDLALAGGEDYELLVAMSPAGYDRLSGEPGGFTLYRIGSVETRDAGITARTPEGAAFPLPAGGWRHF